MSIFSASRATFSEAHRSCSTCRMSFGGVELIFMMEIQQISIFILSISLASNFSSARLSSSDAISFPSIVPHPLRPQFNRRFVYQRLLLPPLKVKLIALNDSSSSSSSPEGRRKIDAEISARQIVLTAPENGMEQKSASKFFYAGDKKLLLAAKFPPGRHNSPLFIARSDGNSSQSAMSPLNA